MWSLSMSLFVAVLFVLVTPGVLVRLPPGGSKLTVAIVHGIVFAIVFHLTHKMVSRYIHRENFQEMEEDEKKKGPIQSQ
jgi:hypothetical protein